MVSTQPKLLEQFSCGARVPKLIVDADTLHKTIPIRLFRVAGVDVQLFEIQIGKHIRRGQTSAWVARFGPMGGCKYAHTHLTGLLLERNIFVFCHVS